MQMLLFTPLRNGDGNEGISDASVQCQSQQDVGCGGVVGAGCVGLVGWWGGGCGMAAHVPWQGVM